jgi:hypothetical protein
MLGGDDFQSYPLLLVTIFRKPYRGKPSCAQLVYDPVSSTVICIAQVDRMKAAWQISLDIFGKVASTLRQQESGIILFVGLSPDISERHACMDMRGRKKTGLDIECQFE